MELCEKLRELRKRKGLTQEELAQALYVSRTAISKWESGRGYPNIDSLKAIAVYFSVTVDALLSSDEVLVIAQNEQNQKRSQLCDLVFGLLNVGAILLLFLPCFGQRVDGVLQEVSLLQLVSVAVYMRVAYLCAVFLMVLIGIFLLILSYGHDSQRMKWRHPVLLVLDGLSALLFILGSQPYAATLLFVFLVIQVLLWMKT